MCCKPFLLSLRLTNMIKGRQDVNHEKKCFYNGLFNNFICSPGLVFLTILFAVPVLSSAAETTPKQKITVLNPVLTNVPPVIDGVLDDEAWKPGPIVDDNSRRQQGKGDRQKNKKLLTKHFGSGIIDFLLFK